MDPAVVAAAFDRLAAEDRFSGALLVVAGDHRLTLARGLANQATGVPISAATRFNVASLTKLCTAVAVCRLLEDRPDRFDDPVASWLGTRVSAELGRLTPRQLLTHTSGLPEQVPDEPDGMIGSDWLAPLEAVDLDFAPGTGWQYSNAGYSVLGAVIEHETQIPYFDAMQHLLFEPAQMASTRFEDTASPAPGRAVGYARAAGDDPPTVPTLDAGLGRGAPYGYGFSTLEDLERLVRSVADHRIVGRQSAAAILFGRTPTGTPGRYAGFGMFSEEVGRSRVATSAGAGPGISTWLDFVPESGYLAIVLSNFAKPAAHEVGEGLRRLVLAD